MIELPAFSKYGIRKLFLTGEVCENDEFEMQQTEFVHSCPSSKWLIVKLTSVIELPAFSKMRYQKNYF